MDVDRFVQYYMVSLCAGGSIMGRYMLENWSEKRRTRIWMREWIKDREKPETRTFMRLQHRFLEVSNDKIVCYIYKKKYIIHAAICAVYFFCITDTALLHLLPKISNKTTRPMCQLTVSVKRLCVMEADLFVNF